MTNVSIQIQADLADQTVWDALLDTAHAAHGTPALSAFVPFPTDVRRGGIAPRRAGGADLMEADPLLRAASHPLAQAFREAAPEAGWYEPYPGDEISLDFSSRFGCYCLIGAEGRQDAPFYSSQMTAYVVYMPPRLHYPWHNHLGEELYLVLAGEAEFHVEGEPSRILGVGSTVEHAAWQRHALTTHESPVLAYVIWRSDLLAKPQLTHETAA